MLTEAIGKKKGVDHKVSIELNTMPTAEYVILINTKYNKERRKSIMRRADHFLYGYSKDLPKTPIIEYEMAKFDKFETQIKLLNKWGCLYV